MKKRALSLLLVLAMMVSLAACGGGGGPAGSYKLTKVSMSGMDIDVEQLGSMMGVDVNVTLEIKADGSWSMDASALGMGTEAVSGTWTASGSTIDLTAEGETLTATLNGSTLVMEEDGESLTFQKQ